MREQREKSKGVRCMVKSPYIYFLELFTAIRINNVMDSMYQLTLKNES